LIRGLGFDLLLNANNPSPIKFEYRVNQEERDEVRRTRHWFQLSYDQRPGPNQTLGFSLSNLNWEHMRPDGSLARQWNLRLDYSVRF
jgi:hypothetical protein